MNEVIDLNNLIIGVNLAALLTTILMGIFVFVKLKSEKRGYFVFFIFCVVVYEMGLLFELMASTTDGGFIATMVTYSGAMLICPTFLMFVQKYCEKDLAKIVNILLYSTAAFVIMLVCTSQHHDLYYTSMEYRTDGAVHTLAIERGILYPLGDLHPTLCMVIAVVMLIQRMAVVPKGNKKRIVILIFCAVAPALSQLLTLFRVSIYNIETTTFFLVAAIIVAYFGLIRYDLLENEETIRIKKDFLQDLNHELRTPLAVVGSGIDLIDRQLGSENSDPETLKKAVGTIRNQILRISHMLDGMVELAYISETGANRRKINFAALLKNNAEAFRLECDKKGIELCVDIMPDLPPVFVERDRISQVVANLLSNAVRHTEKGRITLTAQQDKQFIKACITDTGEGIPQEILPDIFDRGVSGSGGTGYGLYICKTIIQAHGGTIEIDNDDNGCEKGTAVTFTIPIYSGQEVGRK